MPINQVNEKQQKTSSLKIAASAISYRVPLPVTQVLRVRGGDVYPICPRCNSSFEREYTNYCDRCGQRLAWKLFRFATIKQAGEG